MNLTERCIRISLSYYNQGLAAARVRDMTGAVKALQAALRFDKANTQARNLLGLVYYEIGESGAALVQWVISTNLQPRSNRASIYLNDLQQRPGRLRAFSQTTARYNSALTLAQNGNPDLAILELNRVIEEEPSFVRARLLLSACLLKNGEFTRARQELNQVLLTDRTNPTALLYLADIDEQAGRHAPERKRKKKSQDRQEAERKLSGNDVIIPPTYHESTGWQTFLNICLGLLIGAAAVLFLYLPAKTTALSAEHNQDLISVSRKLSDANARALGAEESLKKSKEENGRLTEQLNTIVEADTYRLSQYQKLVGILDDYRNGDYSHAADLFATIDVNELTDMDDGSGVSVTSIYQSIAGRMLTEGYVSLYREGETLYNVADYDSAIEYYDKALRINPDYEEALFKKAMAYKKLGDLQNANSLFGEVILKFPDTSLASRAKQERGY